MRVCRRERWIFTFVAGFIAAWASASLAEYFPGFGQFAPEPINAPGSYRIIADPTGLAPTARVQSFRIDAGACSSKKYDNGNSDCTFHSVRSQAYELAKNQPAEAWYAWSMYLPPDFPVGKEQKAGGNLLFAYWHNGDCQNLDVNVPRGSTKLYFQTNLFYGAGKCPPDQRVAFADLAAMRGQWHRFEVHVKWSKGADGLAELFLDGKKAATIRGRNITPNTHPQNYFKFGLYQNNTLATEKLVTETAFYTGISRASTRDGLRR